MSTLKMGLTLSVSILVIALAVKSVAFEGKSDTLRQALRQELLAVSAECQKYSPAGLERKEIHVSPTVLRMKEVSLPEIMEDIFLQVISWIIKNERENEIEAIVIPARATGNEKGHPGSNEKFNPPGCIILYKKK